MLLGWFTQLTNHRIDWLIGLREFSGTLGLWPFESKMVSNEIKKLIGTVIGTQMKNTVNVRVAHTVQLSKYNKVWTNRKQLIASLPRPVFSRLWQNTRTTWLTRRLESALLGMLCRSPRVLDWLLESIMWWRVWCGGPVDISIKSQTLFIPTDIVTFQLAELWMANRRTLFANPTTSWWVLPDRYPHSFAIIHKSNLNRDFWRCIQQH